MAYARRSQRELHDERKAVRREEMGRAIVEGRLIVRQMSAEERAASDARPMVARGRPRSRRYSR